MEFCKRYVTCCLAVLASASISLAQDTPSNFSQQCRTFGDTLSLPNTTVNVVQFVPNGTNLTFPYNNVTCNRASQLIYSGDMCRLGMTVKTSNASRITLEAWLPASWNGRFLSTGNGGISGCIQYEDIAYATSFGFAAVGANNGHNGTGGTAFAESPGVVEDFVYRSVHTGVVVGKEITRDFYGRNFSYSYYLGCSTGGRQGMKSAQAFPDDFDGIVAGAPAFDFNNLQSWSGHLTQLAGFDNTSASFVTAGHWALVSAHVLAQCDALDGAPDGIIEDPDLCHPSFSALLCPSENTTVNASTCLNAQQVERVAAILSPFYGLDGTLLYPRMQPGAELAAYPLLYAGQPFPYTTDWMRYVVHRNASWDPRAQTLEDAAYADELDPFGVSTWSGNLTAFRARGGKVLTYHGLQDQLISSENSARYYARLAETMGMPPEELDEFYRYFRIAGMAHCRGGPGAADIGQRPSSRPQTAESNILLAMMNWVENGTAPEFIRGYSSPTAGTQQYTRKHCKYPARNAYVGPGNYTDESTWRCVTDAVEGLSVQG